MYQDLDDIVFEDRHKAYGAYEIRKHYDYTLTKALIAGAVVSLLLFLFFFISFRNTPKKTPLVQDMVQMDVTNMLTNIGDETNGTELDEPKTEEGSPAPLQDEKEKIEEPAPKEETKPLEKKVEKPVPENIVPTPTRMATKTTPSKYVETKKETKTNTVTAEKKTAEKESKTVAKVNIKNEGGTGEGQGNAAIGNLLRGRGSKGNSQGSGSGSGNAGDPLGGEGNGDSTVGIDRKLIAYIPGTMGRGGSQPKHNCTTSGSITISYTVDKAGNVISARRTSGLSDPCAVSTTEQWVKQYVKAEKATNSSKGTYKIVF